MAASPTKSANSRSAVADLRAGRRAPSRPNSGSRSSGSRSGGRTTARRGSGVWETARAFLGTVVLFLVIRTFLVEAFRIPSGSMIPTLLVGDWLFVNKLVYGPHLPFTNVTLPGYADPKRGDVVVFESPYQGDEAARGADATPTLVKRLVGLPGDTLYMRDGLLYVDGIAQRQGFATTSNFKGDPNLTDSLFTWQRQYALSASRFGAAPATPTHDNWGPLVIPPRHYMMLGDNRYCSKDSRYWGLVPRANLRGRPIFVYYSYRPAPDDDAGPNSCDPDRSEKPAPFVTDVRWGRVGHVIR